MPCTGQTVVNEASGETITFLTTAADSAGERVDLLFEVRGGGAPPAAHVHPHQTETFTLHEGRCHVRIGGEEREFAPGDTVAVPPGVPHLWSAITDVRMTVTLEPALRADEFFEEYCALAQAGHTDDKGMPTPLRFAILAEGHRDLVHLAGPPVWLQRAIFAVLARIGRARGYRPMVPATA